MEAETKLGLLAIFNLGLNSNLFLRSKSSAQGNLWLHDKKQFRQIICILFRWLFFAFGQHAIPRQSTGCEQNTFSHCMYRRRHFISTSHMMFTFTRGSRLKLKCVPETFLIPSLVSRHVSRPAQYTQHFVLFFTLLYYSFHWLRLKVDHVQNALRRFTRPQRRRFYGSRTSHTPLHTHIPTSTSARPSPPRIAVFAVLVTGLLTQHYSIDSQFVLRFSYGVHTTTDCTKVEHFLFAGVSGCSYRTSSSIATAGPHNEFASHHGHAVFLVSEGWSNWSYSFRGSTAFRGAFPVFQRCTLNSVASPSKCTLITTLYLTAQSDFVKERRLQELVKMQSECIGAYKSHPRTRIVRSMPTSAAGRNTNGLGRRSQAKCMVTIPSISLFTCIAWCRRVRAVSMVTADMQWLRH